MEQSAVGACDADMEIAGRVTGAGDMLERRRQGGPYRGPHVSEALHPSSVWLAETVIQPTVGGAQAQLHVAGGVPGAADVRVRSGARPHERLEVSEVGP